MNIRKTNRRLKFSDGSLHHKILIMCIDVGGFMDDDIFREYFDKLRRNMW